MRIILLVLLTFVSTLLSATHNRSGEITYEQIGPLTIRATITTYTKASSTDADRDSLTLNWGDNTAELIPRTNISNPLPGEDIQVNVYQMEHTYPGRATYTLSFMDPNRVNNIQNVNFPNSVDVPFYVQTTFTFVNTQFQGFNNSVILLQPPIDFACVGRTFLHNPNAYDPDGDSLSYELVTPFQSEGMEVPRYELPDEILPGPDNQISLDPVTGDFVWDAPQTAGEYNIAIKINEYRRGVLLNSVIRDMQIFVDICNNNPPTIEVEKEFCVIAGTRLEIPIIIDDPDDGQEVRLFGTGGPFLVDFSNAQLTGNNEYGPVERTEALVWETKCEHISDSYYQIVIRAQDNSINGTSGLAVLTTIRIKVVGPPPEDVSAEILDNDEVRIEWELPYLCENTLDNYFIGFSVWRKESSSQFVIDTCTGGLDGRGYTAVNFLTNQNENGRYFYIDNNLDKSTIYCYRVLANFARRTPSGNPFNIVESLPSREVCLQLDQDIPLITKVSVTATANTAGSIAVEWIKPLPDDVDTMLNPGPYRYEILRSIDNNTYSQITNGEYETTNFADPIDLNYADNGLNTIVNQYYYKIDFYSANNYFSSSPIASSVYSILQSSDQINTISWQENTPWVNYLYRIFRKDDLMSNFALYDSTASNTFEDRDVDNNREYCYVIESEGNYGLSTVPSPLINRSQEVCGIPIDTVGPCAPTLSVESPCVLINEGIPITEFINILNWTMPNLTCENSDDLEFYKIYYAPNRLESLELLIELDNTENTYDHIPDIGITGCYAISAVDILGNEGPLSEVVCVESCSVYILPNTFTPNQDGANELFIPIENRFVSAIDLKIYNRWGNIIYETNEPEINWDGIDTKGKEVSEGSYYYTCTVFEDSSDSGTVEANLLSGHIQILR